MTDATVRLRGRDIGAVSWLDDRAIGVFQYMPEFVQSSIELAPIMMPLRPDPYEFSGLPRDAFKGLPGMLANSLPDKFGNALIDTWLATQGRLAGSFNPVERLCYIGTRGMALSSFIQLSSKGRENPNALRSTRSPSWPTTCSTIAPPSAVSSTATTTTKPCRKSCALGRPQAAHAPRPSLPGMKKPGNSVPVRLKPVKASPTGL